MILSGKKTFTMKSAQQFLRFVPSFNPVCLSLITALLYGSESSSCLLKTHLVRTTIFSKPWPQLIEGAHTNFPTGHELTQCVMLANVTLHEMHFLGQSEYLQSHE